MESNTIIFDKIVAGDFYPLFSSQRTEDFKEMMRLQIEGARAAKRVVYYPDLESQINEKHGYGSIDSCKSLISAIEPIASSSDFGWFEINQTELISKMFHFGKEISGPSNLVSRIGGLVCRYDNDVSNIEASSLDDISQDVFDLIEDRIDELRNDFKSASEFFDVTIYCYGKENKHSNKEIVIGPFGSTKFIVDKNSRFIRSVNLFQDHDQSEIVSLWSPLVDPEHIDTKRFQSTECRDPMSLVSSLSSIASLAIMNAFQRFEDELAVEELFSGI